MTRIVDVLVLATVSVTKLHWCFLGVDEPFRQVLPRLELLYLDVAALRVGEILLDLRPVVLRICLHGSKAR